MAEIPVVGSLEGDIPAVVDSTAAVAGSTAVEVDSRVAVVGIAPVGVGNKVVGVGIAVGTEVGTAEVEGGIAVAVVGEPADHLTWRQTS